MTMITLKGIAGVLHLDSGPADEALLFNSVSHSERQLVWSCFGLLHSVHVRASYLLRIV
jgi:hypothetical protein